MFSALLRFLTIFKLLFRVYGFKGYHRSQNFVFSRKGIIVVK